MEVPSFECVESKALAQLLMVSENKSVSLLQPFASTNCLCSSRRITVCFRDDLKGASFVANEKTVERSL